MTHGDGGPRLKPAAAILCGCLALAYANTFDVPFLLDDTFNIAKNASIRSLWHLAAVLRSVDATTIAGRPLLNLTFAINFAVSGLSVAGYHWVNLLIHALATLTLFELVRRSIDLASLQEKLPASTFAFLVAALWALHPLQTEAVTYISERAESLMGLFCLLTLYGLCRQTAPYLALSVTACACGMATKQSMVAAPALALLFDRAFLSASFREAFQTRWRYYAALGGTWILLAVLMVLFHLRSGSIGFRTSIAPIDYALTEAKAIARYGTLAFWPRSLVFDYGAEWYPAHPGSLAWLAALIVLACAGAIALWRISRPAGFLACAFFILLAPTSSIVPIAYQPMAESRMYLPLAALLTLAAGCAWLRLGRVAGWGLLMAAALCAALTHHRNHIYRNPLEIWEDTIAKNPHSSRGQNNLGLQLEHAGRWEDAVAPFREAIRISPKDWGAWCNLADVLMRIPGQRDAAIATYRQSLRWAPDLAPAHFGLANALAMESNHLDEAAQEYEAAVRLAPGYSDARDRLADTLARLQQASNRPAGLAAHAN